MEGGGGGVLGKHQFMPRVQIQIASTSPSASRVAGWTEINFNML